MAGAPRHPNRANFQLQRLDASTPCIQIIDTLISTSIPALEMPASSDRQHSKKQKRSSAARAPEAADIGLVLDQNEVMKAMMAAAASNKGKGRAEVDDSEEETDEADEGGSAEDDGSEDEDGSGAERNGAASPQEEATSDSNSEAGPSSPRAASPPRKAAPSISRVNISKGTSAAGPAPVSAFSSEPKPAATTTFESLGLSAPLISALGSINISRPTEIQSACVHAIMSGRDCIGGAKTGSGKTLAFALPIVERIARDPFGVWAVVLTPTR
jgi:ATP-dependent RNA helicase DDX49/DBP8